MSLDVGSIRWDRVDWGEGTASRDEYDCEGVEGEEEICGTGVDCVWFVSWVIWRMGKRMRLRMGRY